MTKATPGRPSHAIELSCIAEVADIAKVPQSSRQIFSRMMLSAIATAHQGNKVHQDQPRARDIKPYFSRLRKSLEAMQPLGEKEVGAKYDYLGEVAGNALEISLKNTNITDLIEAVDRAERSSTLNEGTRLPKRRSSTVDPTFSLFVHMLLAATNGCGGALKSYRGSHAPSAKGTYIDALNTLKPCLPGGIFPSSPSALQDTYIKASAGLNGTK